MFVFYDPGDGSLIGSNEAIFWDREGYVSSFAHSAYCVWMVPGTFDPNED